MLAATYFSSYEKAKYPAFSSTSDGKEGPFVHVFVSQKRCSALPVIPSRLPLGLIATVPPSPPDNFVIFCPDGKVWIWAGRSWYVVATHFLSGLTDISLMVDIPSMVKRVCPVRTSHTTPLASFSDVRQTSGEASKGAEPRAYVSHLVSLLLPV